jgi:DNA ligase 1
MHKIRLRAAEGGSLILQALRLPWGGSPGVVESNIEPSVWVDPQVVIEVLADEITRSPVHPTGADEGGQGYALRFPRLVGFRQDDKKPEDVTTIAEIVELYNPTP